MLNLKVKKCNVRLKMPSGSGVPYSADNSEEVLRLEIERLKKIIAALTGKEEWKQKCETKYN